MSIKKVAIHYPSGQAVSRDDLVRMQQLLVHAINELLDRTTAVEARVTTIEARLLAAGIP